jgi:hypothetical protein
MEYKAGLEVTSRHRSQFSAWKSKPGLEVKAGMKVAFALDNARHEGRPPGEDFLA